MQTEYQLKTQKANEEIKSGKFIVFEGLDGSGKSTQSNLLKIRLEEKGYQVEKIDFPQYGQKSAGLVEEYLNAKYGSAESVGPYRASIFFACDRYDASFKIKQWLLGGKIVISDRYVGSNVGHQGGKIKDKEKRDEYVKWLYNLEYGIFQIPQPDLCLILKTTPQIAFARAPEVEEQEKKQKRWGYLKSEVRDLHERDLNHLADALDCYLEVGQKFKEEFKIIDCLENNQLLTIEKIQERVWEVVKQIL